MSNKNCFDFLRIAFAINVFLAHLWELSECKSLYFLSDYTNSMIAVKGFFVISGFLVAKSYTNTSSLKNYFIKRAKRILPAYLVVIVTTTLGLAFVSQYSFWDYFSDSGVYKYLSWNAIFLNFVHPCLPAVFDGNLLCAVNGALWTLKVEEGFYLVLPFIFYLANKTKRSFYIFLGIYILSLLYTYGMNYIDKPLLAKQLPGQMTYFVVGIYLYMNLSSVLKNKYLLLFIGVLLLVSAGFWGPHIAILYPFIFGLVIICAAYSFPFLNNFGKYGDFTYGLYIYHFPIIQVFRSYNLFEKYNPFLMAISIFMITTILAVFSWFVVEKRFIARYNNLRNPISL
jgi:peptidoglycan/LPS O-acetylase OafA/YrhL